MNDAIDIRVEPPSSNVEYQSSCSPKNLVDDEVTSLALEHDYVIEHFLAQGNDQVADAFRKHFRRLQHSQVNTSISSSSTGSHNSSGSSNQNGKIITANEDLEGNASIGSPIGTSNKKEQATPKKDLKGDETIHTSPPPPDQLTEEQEGRLFAFRQYYKLHEHQATVFWLLPSTITDFNSFHKVLLDKSRRRSKVSRKRRQRRRENTKSEAGLSVLMSGGCSHDDDDFIPSMLARPLPGKNDSESTFHYYMRRHRRKKIVYLLAIITGISSGGILAFYFVRDDIPSIWLAVGLFGGLVVACVGMPAILGLVDCCENDGCYECYDFSCFGR